MPSDLYSLSILPLVVQDSILENLDRRSLVQVSLACRSLQRGVQKYLYRKLIYYQKHCDLVESNIRRNPTLVPYIRSFTSYDPSFLKWMWMQMTSSLKELELLWDNTIEINAYSELFESIPQSCVEGLTFGLMPGFEFRMMSSRRVFSGLRFLHLRICAMPKYTLQTILDQLHAPSLEILEVEYLTDWRIQWRELFDDTMPNLAGLRLRIREWEEGVVMFDSEEDHEREEKMPPSNVKWDTVLTLYRRSLFFEIFYDDSSSPFLDHAPSYASAHQLDPVLLVQWLVKSEQFFLTKLGVDDVFVNISEIPFSDLSTILRSIKSMDFRCSKMDLRLHLPVGTTSSIADLLPNNIVDLTISPPFVGFLDPSVVPECIRSLPKLQHLGIYIHVSKPDFQPRNGCTAATCSFPPLVRGMSIFGVQLKAARGSDPVWRHGWHQRDIDKHDLGDVDDFEREVKEWFRLSRSLESLDICFDKPASNYTMNIS